METALTEEQQWGGREVLHGLKALQEPVPAEQQGVATDWPDWVHKLFADLLPSLTSPTEVEEIDKWRVNGLGGFLAGQYACSEMMFGEVELSPRMEKEGKKSTAALLSYTTIWS